MTNNITAVVAMDYNFGIGNNDALPWTLPSDLEGFKELTSGNVIIMGRKTHESIGRALPNRINVVMTRNKDYVPLGEGVLVVHDIEGAMSAIESHGVDAFIIGGEEIYKTFATSLTHAVISIVDTVTSCDAHFPFGEVMSRATSVESIEYVDSNMDDHQYSILSVALK